MLSQAESNLKSNINCNHLNHSILKLEEGIREFGNYYDGLVFKGRLEMKSSNYQSAQTTLNSAKEMFPLRS
jgi:hypothetical protein